MLGIMLQPPHIRARRRFLGALLGPALAALIIGAGAFYYLGPVRLRQPSETPAATPAAAPITSPVAAEAPVAPAPPEAKPASLAGTAFPNCAAARAAGAAPVRRGQPGYGPHLDRDNDGVGCEPYRAR